MDNIRIHNWEKWQSYRADRGQPPWIKIHRRIMRNVEWVSLTDSERGQLVAMWLLAADHDGVIPASPAIIQKLCFMSTTPNLQRFVELGFIESNGVNLASTWRQHDSPKAEAKAEAKAEEKKKELPKFELPDWMPESLWSVFLSNRKSVKAPVTKESYPLFIEKFFRLKAKGYMPEFVIGTMVERGWRWFKPEWVKESNPMVAKFGEKGARTVASMQKWLEETKDEE